MNNYSKDRAKKTGLVLGLGAAPGLAHIGVIKVLKQHDVRVDIVSGSSIGAFIGACYAKDGDIAGVEELFLNTDWTKAAQLLDPKLSALSKGLLSGEKVKEFLKSVIGDVKFKDLKIPLAVVATDLDTGEEVVFREGSVLDAVRASISIPAVFVPVKCGDRYLIDGGSSNPLPVDVVKKMGAEYVIVSNIVPSPSERDTSVKNKSNKEDSGNIFDNIKEKIFNYDEDMLPNMFDVLMQAMHVTEYKIVERKLQKADLVITPEIKNIPTLDFTRAREAIKKGEEAAKKVFKRDEQNR
jgi:NTE family protein